MAELPSDDSDIYVSGDSSEECLVSDQPSSSASHGSRLSTSAETESNCNEEVDELESIDSSEYLELHTTNSLQDSDEDFDLDIAGDSDSDVRPNYVEEEVDEDEFSDASPGDFASLESVTFDLLAMDRILS